MFLTRNNDMDVERAITAIIVCDTLEDAVEILKEQGVQTTAARLKVWRDHDPVVRERYEERRQELAPMLEGIYANDLLDTARRSNLAVRLAVESSIERLQAGKVQDPSRMARDLSQVGTQAIDKRLAVQGRPTQIIERRDPDEIIRALVALGVAEHTVEGTVTEDDADDTT